MRWAEFEDSIRVALDGQTFAGVTLTEAENLFFGGAEQTQVAALSEYVVVRFEGSTAVTAGAAGQVGSDVLMGVIVASQVRETMRSMVTEVHDTLVALCTTVEALPEGKAGPQHYALGLGVTQT